LQAAGHLGDPGRQLRQVNRHLLGAVRACEVAEEAGRGERDERVRAVVAMGASAGTESYVKSRSLPPASVVVRGWKKRRRR
jgi:hypothetical protein